MGFAVESSEADGVLLVAISGEIDLLGIPEFERELLGGIERGHTRAIVEVADGTFIDSTALGVLATAVKRLRAADGDLAIVCTDRNVKKILQITGFDRVISVHPDRPQALAAV